MKGGALSLAEPRAGAPSASTIPRTIHYCWFGSSPVSPLGERCIATWREVMPSYVLERWDESRDWKTPYTAIAYRARKFAFVADYVRLRALYERGGIYLDTDVEVLKPFDPLLTDQLFFGLQTPDSVAAGVIGAVKGHPFLKLALDRLDSEAKSGKLSFQPLPELITALARRRGAVAPKLYPVEYFYPYNPHSADPLRQKPLQCNVSEHTFCIHHWEGTWLGGISLGMMIRLRLRDRLRKLAPVRWRSSAPGASGASP
jgi:hypothetical protein